MIASGTGFFVSDQVAVVEGKEIHLTANQRTAIAATTPIAVSLSNADIWIADSRLVPIGRGFLVGNLKTTGTELQVNKTSKLDVVVVKPPNNGKSQGKAFLLHLSGVSPTNVIRIEAEPRRLARIGFDMSDSKGRKCKDALLRVSMPAFSDAYYDFFRNKDVDWDELSLWFTPEMVCATSFHLPPKGPALEFYPRIVNGKAGQEYPVRSGGRLDPRAWFYPENNPREVWIEVCEAGAGAGVRDVAWPGRAAPVSVRFTGDDGKTAFSEDIGSGLKKALSQDPTGLNYVVKLDLGELGDYQIAGKCFSASNRLSILRQETEHCSIVFPAILASGLEQFASMVDSSCASISEATGLRLTKGVKFRPNLACTGWTGGGGSVFSVDIGALKSACFLDYPRDFGKGPLAHEIGHVFQGKSQGLVDWGGPDLQHKEAIANCLRNIAKRELIGIRPARIDDIHERQLFFVWLYQTNGLKDELQQSEQANRDCANSLWRYIFLMEHLTDIYGPQIHGTVARLWGHPDPTRNLHRILASKSFTPSEIVCASYSLATGQDLGWLFRVAGFEIRQELMNRLPPVVGVIGRE